MVRLQVGMVCQGGARTTVTSLRIIRLRVVNISVAALRLGLVKRATMSYNSDASSGKSTRSTHPFAMNRPSIPALFREQVAKLRSRPMITANETDTGALDVVADVGAVSGGGGPLQLGLEPGSVSQSLAIAVWRGRSRPCPPVGGDCRRSDFRTASAEDIIWILKDSGSKGAFVGDPDTLAVIECRDELPELKFIFVSMMRCGLSTTPLRSHVCVLKPRTRW